MIQQVEMGREVTEDSSRWRRLEGLPECGEDSFGM